MKKDNENAALLSMFDELVDEVKKNRQAIAQLQNTIQRHDIGKIVDESIYVALNEKFPNKSQLEKDEETKRYHQAMATWTTQREKNLFNQYIKPTLTPLSMELKRKLKPQQGVSSMNTARNGNLKRWHTTKQ